MQQPPPLHPLHTLTDNVGSVTVNAKTTVHCSPGSTMICTPHWRDMSLPPTHPHCKNSKIQLPVLSHIATFPFSLVCMYTFAETSTLFFDRLPGASDLGSTMFSLGVVCFVELAGTTTKGNSVCILLSSNSMNPNLYL